ncbi:MAG: LysR substrate-binding domain-containing protein [Alphaproteobacteria bacterium]
MELRQLRTFRSVAELGSLSKAADRLRIAQPALSRQIKLLEHELRTPLFVRNGRGMALTDAGKVLLARIGGLVRQLEQVRDDVASLSGAPSGQVVLGVVPTVSTVLASRLAQAVLRDRPGISLRIVESFGGHLLEWLHRGELDLAVIYGRGPDLHLRTETLARDELMAVGGRGSGLAKRKGVSIEWVARQPLILPSPPHGLRTLIDTTAAKRKLSLNVLLETDSFRVQMDVVESGHGYTVLPPSAIFRELRQGRLEAAPITAPRLTRELVLAFPTGRAPSLATNAIAGLIRAEVAAVGKDGHWAAVNAPARRTG